MELQQRLCPPVKPVTGRRGEHGPRVKTAANSIMLVDELVLAKSIHNEIRYYLVRTPNVLFTLEIVEIKKKKKNNNLLSGQTEEVYFSSKRGDPRLTFYFCCAV